MTRSEANDNTSSFILPAINVINSERLMLRVSAVVFSNDLNIALQCH